MAKQQVQEQAAHGLSPGTVIDGRYKIVRFIGQGGNGFVHEVEHVWTGRRLALKTLVDESGFGRLEQEARATCLMKNDHAVRITDMGKSDKQGPYLVMELLEGQSLRALLDETGQLPLELTVNIALQVCECLTEAHALGIIHRDLKPDNIFLCPSVWQGQYDVRILDFGVVKITNEGPIPNSSLTRTGSTVGTPYYMSLEQLRNPSNVDARADVYAFGVVLYESFAGRKPFQAETIGDLVYALCSGPPTHLHRLRPDLPADVCDAVMKALSMKKEDRQAGMADLAKTLVGHGNTAFSQWLKSVQKPRLATLTPSPSAAPLSTASAPRPLRTTVRMNENSPPSALKKSGTGAPSPLGTRPLPPSPSDLPPLSTTTALPIEYAASLPSAGAAPAPEIKGDGAQMDRGHMMEDMPDPTDPTRVQLNRSPAERPAVDFAGDRDTPTEMFVKGRHDAPKPSGPGAHGPGQGIDEDDASETARYQGGPISQAMASAAEGAAGVGKMRIPARPEDAAAAQRAEILGTVRLPSSETIEEVRAAIRSNAGMPSGVMAPASIRDYPAPSFGQGAYGPPSNPQGAMPPPSAYNTTPPVGYGTSPPPGYGSPTFGMNTIPPDPRGPRPQWQQPLDSALMSSGRIFEKAFGPIATRIRQASPRTQLILAAVTASIVAAFFVLLIYLVLG